LGKYKLLHQTIEPDNLDLLSSLFSKTFREFVNSLQNYLSFYFNLYGFRGGGVHTYILEGFAMSSVSVKA